VGDEEMNHCFDQQPQAASSSRHLLPLPIPVAEATPMAYNDKVVAFLRQPNIMDILKEKSSKSVGGQRGLKDKIMAIRQEGSAALKRFSHDIELTLLLRYLK
jgi:hypothetical protein